MELNIAAVGSSRLIAAELQDILRSIFGGGIHVTPLLAEEAAANGAAADLYVCARTTYPQLKETLPHDKLLCMDLQPDATFFLSIARLPAGTRVCIFNNYLAYPVFLADYCRSLGLDHVTYTPLAFRECSEAALRAALSEAHCIIGVDRFVNMLREEPYRSALPADAVLIAGKRTASLPSAFAVIRSVGSIALDKLHARCRHLDALPAEELTAAFTEVNNAIDLLRAAAISSVVNQAAVAAHIDNAREETRTAAPQDPAAIRQAIKERMTLLHTLQDKLQTLGQ